MTKRRSTDPSRLWDNNEAIVGLFGRASHPAYGDSYVRRFLVLLDKSGIVAEVEKWRLEDCPPAGPGGRPPRVSTRAMLLGLLLTARTNQSTLLSAASTALAFRLTATMQEELQIAIKPGESDYEYEANVFHSLRRRFHQFVEPLDSSVWPKDQRKLTFSEIAKLSESRPIDGVDSNDTRLNWIANQIIELSWATLPRDVRRKWDGAMGIDATFVKTWAKGSYFKGDRAGSDPDAGWYKRTDGGYIPGVDKEAKGKNVKIAKYGYDATIAVAQDPRFVESQTFPRLVVGMSLDIPAARVAENSMNILNSAHERNMPAGLLAGDRAYNNSKPEKFQLPALELGYKMVFDYKAGDLGIQDNYKGAIQVEGRWYCAAMRSDLITASIDYYRPASDSDAISWETYQVRLKERVPFEMRVKETRTGADGSRRTIFACPASGDSPTILHCSAKSGKPKDIAKIRAEKPRSTAVKKGLRIVGTEPFGDVCTNLNSTSFRASAGAKHGQALRYQSVEWQETYGVLRNAIEGLNGNTENSHGLESASRRRVRGRAAISILLAIQLWAENMSRIEKWLSDLRVDAEHGASAHRPHVGKRRAAAERYREGVATERRRPLARST